MKIISIKKDEEFKKKGVDLTLLWENLNRTPTERVLRNEKMAESVEEIWRQRGFYGLLREGNQKTQPK